MGVVFGGRSVEHDVSIITGLQACDALAARHAPVALYIDRDGRWFSGAGLRDVAGYRAGAPGGVPVLLDITSGMLRRVPSAAPETRRRTRFGAGRDRGAASELGLTDDIPERLDVILPATHGTQGEDGALQGALELASIPYAGPTLESAALAMNKATTKIVLRAAGIPVLDDIVLRREDHERDGAAALVARVLARFALPVYAKPASLGSSVGVSRATDESSLAEALELCFELDRVAIVEPAVEGGREINCAVLGRPGSPPRISVCEEPIASDGLLSFQDKYLRGAVKGEDKTGGADAGAGKSGGLTSAQRIIPAPISDALTARARELAAQTCVAIGATGVTRVDMLLDADERLIVNEPNTIPGSFASYLFEHAGLPFVDLMDELLDIALAEHVERRRTTRTFASNLLAMRGEGSKAGG